MEDKWIRIAITPPSILQNEAQSIKDIINAGEADFVHLRHPGVSKEEIRQILLNLPESDRHKITLHDHFSLAAEGLCGGIQLNSRNCTVPDSLKGCCSRIRISRSCHSIEEIKSLPDSEYSYVTLSPILNSISKRGYNSAFNEYELKSGLSDCKLPVIALGGITPDRFAILKTLGFKGAAMLGYFRKYFKSSS